MAKTKKNNLPTHVSMMNPMLSAMHMLGGSGTIDEINGKSIEILHLPDSILEIPHSKGSRTEVEYRLAWTRTYLKKYGVLENSSRGVWAIKNEKRNIAQVDPKEVAKYVRELERKDKEKKPSASTENEDDLPDEIKEWKEELIDILMKVEPAAFERLIQRLLRESGFSQVEVTGKTGDGGIDGKGIYRIGGLISFNVLFQCKRWAKTVGPGEIRDFRGAMQGRADKGLFVTTGTYTREAIKEASRDGATPIDILDGEALAEKLKELKLGIETELIEKVTINEIWYSQL